LESAARRTPPAPFWSTRSFTRRLCRVTAEPTCVKERAEHSYDGDTDNKKFLH
jgi:hypothetical protein